MEAVIQNTLVIVEILFRRHTLKDAELPERRYIRTATNSGCASGPVTKSVPANEAAKCGSCFSALALV